MQKLADDDLAQIDEQRDQPEGKIRSATDSPTTGRARISMTG
jgi:hypothetical protein